MATNPFEPWKPDEKVLQECDRVYVSRFNTHRGLSIYTFAWCKDKQSIDVRHAIIDKFAHLIDKEPTYQIVEAKAFLDANGWRQVPLTIDALNDTVLVYVKDQTKS